MLQKLFYVTLLLVHQLHFKRERILEAIPYMLSLHCLITVYCSDLRDWVFIYALLFILCFTPNSQESIGINIVQLIKYKVGLIAEFNLRSTIY